MNLNAGGIIGGLVGGGGAAFVAFSGDAEMRRPGKLVGLGVVVGAAAGNFLWGAVFGSNEDEGDEDHGEEDEDIDEDEE